MRSSPGSTDPGSSPATATSPPKQAECWTCTTAAGRESSWVRTSTSSAPTSWVGLRRVESLQTLRFLSPPSEPDVRVSTHPALHEPMPLGYATDPDGLLAQGVAMLSAR